MSIQSYLQEVFYDDRSRAIGQTLPALTAKGKAMEFQVNVMVTRGFDKTSTKSSTFTIVAKGNATVEGLIQAGSIMASNIAKMSMGVISGFYAKLGKYRNDEIPQDVAPGDNSYTVCTLTNNENDEYMDDKCDGHNRIYPARTVTNNVYIPWMRPDMSDADVIDTLKTFKVTENGVDYVLGYVRFNDDNKQSMTAYPIEHLKYIGTKRASRRTPSFLNNNDTELGIVPDDVLSEEYNTTSDGDDDGNYVPPVNP